MLKPLEAKNPQQKKTFKNKHAGQAEGQILPDAAPPVGKIHPFSKIAVTFEPIQQF